MPADGIDVDTVTYVLTMTLVVVTGDDLAELYAAAKASLVVLVEYETMPELPVELGSDGEPYSVGTLAVFDE